MINLCRLYLVRHGESEANRDNLVGGHWDTPLTEYGRKQALETKELLKHVQFDTVYSSDLMRASQTAEIIFGKPVPKRHQMSDLRERTFGKLEGQGAETTWRQLSRDYEEKYSHLPIEKRLQYNYADFIEGDKQLIERFSKALLKIAKQHPGETVLVGTHGGPIRVLLMKLKFANFISAGDFKNGGYVELASDGSDFEIQKVVGVERSNKGAE